MKFKDFKFVYISTDYLKALHEEDSEIFYAESSGYELKPHLGILIAFDKYNYVIPLTSAKEKHKKWKDVTATNYRIFEIIDIRHSKIDPFDIIVDENNFNKLRAMGVKPDEYKYYKKRILSVLEIKKMFPVPDDKYQIVDLDTPSDSLEVENRRILMQKEYFFCRRIMNSIEEKAHRLYHKQIATGIIEPFSCNFKKLETIAEKYIQ